MDHSESPRNPFSFHPDTHDIEEDRGYPGRASARSIRQAWKREKRRENQLERARVRDALQRRLRDPDSLDDLPSELRRSRRARGDATVRREWMLQERKRKIRSELKAKIDLDEYIRDMCRSKTLHALIALGFFREVLGSDAYGNEHRYKQAIRAALEDPLLSRSLRRKWEAFDRAFPAASENGRD
jgi:hypothetical protein